MIDDLRVMIAEARAKHQKASDRYEATGELYFYYDKGYWLGHSHALEIVLEEEEKNG